MLFDELAALGYAQSYPTFVRKIRNRQLFPFCGACAGNGVVLLRLCGLGRTVRCLMMWTCIGSEN